VDPFTDPTLSLRAKGVYGVILTFDENETVNAETIASCSREGLDTTRGAIRELKNRGYLRMDRTRGQGGLLGAPTYVRTSPRRMTKAERDLVATADNRHGTVGWAYAVSSAERRHVKIGRAVNLRRRLASHNTSSPVQLSIIWSHEGGAGLEVHLHRFFRSRHVRGEWFDFTGIDAVRAITVAAAQFGRAS
jgi:hypothetical protein